MIIRAKAVRSGEGGFLPPFVPASREEKEASGSVRKQGSAPGCVIDTGSDVIFVIARSPSCADGSPVIGELEELGYRPEQVTVLLLLSADVRSCPELRLFPGAEVFACTEDPEGNAPFPVRTGFPDGPFCGFPESRRVCSGVRLVNDPVCGAAVVAEEGDRTYLIPGDHFRGEGADEDRRSSGQGHSDPVSGLLRSRPSVFVPSGMSPV